MTAGNQKFGSAAIVGMTNAGKSTLTNALVGAKVSIVTRKARTTRCRITGIMMHNNAQILLVDTPGIFAPQTPMDKAMVASAWSALDETDIVLHIVDAALKNPLGANELLFSKLPKGKSVLVLNKVDLVKKEDLLTLATEFNLAHPYTAIFMISALNKNGLKELKDAIAAAMQDGPWVYDPEDLTDMPMRFMAAEITREKIFEQLHEELPYSIFVETEEWENFDNGSVKISQAVIVEKDSQKAIVLGKGGSRIKKIGETARLDMKEIFGVTVHLRLFVKVEKNWAERAENYSKLGLGTRK